jgi:hypothetical protein
MMRHFLYDAITHSLTSTHNEPGPIPVDEFKLFNSLSSHVRYRYTV